LLDGISEFILEAIDQLSPNNYFIVYGSLAPGQPNYHEISDVPGVWHEGHIYGNILEVGWGASIGYPGLKWDPSGPKVSASILESNVLHQHWERLDEFEGEEYKRIIIPFHTTNGLKGLGHVYSLNT